MIRRVSYLFTFGQDQLCITRHSAKSSRLTGETAILFLIGLDSEGVCGY